MILIRSFPSVVTLVSIGPQTWLPAADLVQHLTISEIRAKYIFFITTEPNEIKLYRGDPQKVLTKFLYFGADRSTNIATSCGLSLALDSMGSSCKTHLQNCSTNETKLCRNAHYGRLHRNLEENTNIIQLQSVTLYMEGFCLVYIYSIFKR